MTSANLFNRLSSLQDAAMLAHVFISVICLAIESTTPIIFGMLLTLVCVYRDWETDRKSVV